MSDWVENPAVAARRLEALRAYSRRQARSQQIEVGWSEVGGATCALSRKFLAMPTTNPNTSVMAALRGTAFHHVLEEAIPAHDDPDGVRLITEAAVVYDDRPGHLDLYDEQEGVVEDAKTKDAKGMDSVRRYGPDRAYLWQLHGYAAALLEAGKPVNKIRITYYSMSSPDDILVLERPYDATITQEAVDHVTAVRAAAMNGVLAEPERDPATWCKPYCEFYDATGEVGCPGRIRKDAVIAETEPWEEAPTEQAAADYKRGQQMETEGKKLREAAREQLIGTRGIAGPYLVSWTNPVTKETVDKDAAVQVLVEHDLPIPKKLGTATPAISVTVLATDSGEAAVLQGEGGSVASPVLSLDVAS